MIRLQIYRIEPHRYPDRRSAEVNAVSECLRLLELPTSYDHSPSGAPFLENDPRRISVSHSKNYAAVCCADPDDGAFGIDVEQIDRRQFARVVPRICSPEEVSAVGRLEHGPAKAWTAKEAAYKACRSNQIDFTRDIRLRLPDFSEARIEKLDLRLKLDFSLINDDTLLCIAKEIQ